MHTILDASSRQGVITRIKSLEESNTALWGKMNVRQMLSHVTTVEEMYLGKKQYKQNFLGKIFGKVAMKQMLKNEAPIQKNAPTVPGFKGVDPLTTGDTTKNFAGLQAQWVSLVEEYSKLKSGTIVHPFFGEMSKDEIGRLAYKHIDHHLRQFGK